MIAKRGLISKRLYEKGSIAKPWKKDGVFFSFDRSCYLRTDENSSVPIYRYI
ncbi:unnamed protein product [Brassica rapa subsp. narinosa]